MDFVERYSKNARFLKVDRKSLKEYVLDNFKEQDVGRNYFLLSCSSAVRTGFSKYANHINFVPAGSWVGGIVGVKSIFHLTKSQKSKSNAEIYLQELEDKGYICVQQNNKKLDIEVFNVQIGDHIYYGDIETPDAVVGKNGGRYYRGDVKITRQGDQFIQQGVVENFNNTPKDSYYKINWGDAQLNLEDGEFMPTCVYNCDNTGWIPLSKKVFAERVNSFQEKKNKNNRAIRNKRKAEPLTPCEAFFDLYSNTVYRDFENAFSWFAPIVVIGDKTTVSCRDLAERWGWGKSSVQTFLKKHSKVFTCVNLGANCGTLIFNNHLVEDCLVPSEEFLVKTLHELVPDGNIAKNMVEPFIRKNSKKFIKKYFCRGEYCPAGNALRVYVNRYIHSLNQPDDTGDMSFKVHISPIIKPPPIPIIQTVSCVPFAP